MGFELAPVRGVLDHYGPRSTDEQFGGDYGTKDGLKQAVYEFDYDELPAGNGGNLDVAFPAYAKIESVTTEVIEDIAGFTGTTVQSVIGSYDSGAVALTADTKGGTGKDTPAAPTSVGSTGGQNLVVTLGGTGGPATAGRFRIIVSWIMPKE